ncbi:hypothetical protein F4802DRAFT_532235 [Xylaria palmicola]|nr:hypothetical protein F4802DRAFT_532235 [Xylaria palmicola]
MPRPMRSSCDRCHAQKLKCPKEPGIAACSRCLKAGSDCVFSPAGPAWRRPTANSSHQCNAFLLHGSQGDDSFGLDLTWPPLLNVGNSSMDDTDYISPPLPDQTADVTVEDPRSACVRQLSAIAVQIHDVSVELGPIASIHWTSGSDIEAFYSHQTIHVSHSRCIEQLFTLAQRLIDLYPNLLPLLSDGSHPLQGGDCEDPCCFHNSELPEKFADTFTGTNAARSRIDTFLLGLLTACHEKVLDVLDYIVSAAQLCAKITASSPDLIQPRLHIPELRLGSFVASATSASSMQATLFSHITTVLVENARLLRKTITDASKGAGPSDKKTRMMLLQCEVLEERSQLQADQFVRIRDGLIRWAYIK